MQIGGGQTENALFVLAHADKVPLLLGLVLPLVPTITVFMSMLCLKISWSSNLGISELVERFCLILWIPLMYVGIRTGGWIAFSGLIYALLLLDIPLFKFLGNLRRPDADKVPLTHFPAKIFRGREFDVDSVLTIVIFAFFAYPLNQSWVPNECLTLDDKSQFTASVVSSDPKFTYLLTQPGSIPSIVATSSIRNRLVITDNKNPFCKVQKGKSKVSVTSNS